MNVDEKVGRNIRKYRMAYNMTLKELAVRLHKSEVKEPGECGGLYTGEYEKEGFIGTYMLHNQALKSEHIMISCVNNLVNPGQQLALVSGLSNYTMLPVTFKAVISEKEIVNKEKLMNLLAFNKEDLKLMKQMNYLTIQNMR